MKTSKIRNSRVLFIAVLAMIAIIGKAQVSFISNGQNLTSSNSWDIRLVDLNGDFIPDAVFEGKVWLNDGKGNFTKSDMYIGSGFPSFADLNGDGFVDILNQDSIFVNDGTFHFNFSKKLVSDIEMYNSVSTDIDKDGDIDIISCSQTSDKILLNDGKGNFTNTGKSLDGWGQATYAVDDINGDGFTDIYVSIPHIPPMGGHTPNLIWLGDGVGKFSKKTHDIPGAESRGVVLADFDGDGDLDLYVSDATSWGRVFTNDGKGNFTDSGQKIGSKTSPVKAADFNNDGNLDLFICQGDGNGVTGNGAPSTVWLGDGKGFFTDSKVRLQIGNTNSIAVDAGDINNDRKIDAVVANVKLDAQNGYTPIFCPVEIWLNSTFICDFLGQTPPGDTAVLFAPGIISIPDRFESNLVFYPDSNEIYFDAWVTTDTVYKILYTKKVNNKWTDQEALPFKENINTSTPFLSADGKKLYYEKNDDIWRVERTIGGWGDPKLLPSPVNTTSVDYSYSESDDGVGYITSDRPGGKGSYDIWQINSFPNDSFQVENLGTNVNSSNYEYVSCIAHDGSFLIYNTFRYSNYSLQDLWIAFKKENNEWTIPLGMERSGAKINVSNYAQLCPTLSPDGKYLFFSRENATNDQRDVYWVSTHIIIGLKKQAFAPKLSRQIPTMNITTDSTINYVIPENTFTCEYGTNILKYTATLKNGAALPSWLEFEHDTRTLKGTPIQAGIDTIKITATNIDNESASCTFKIKVTLIVGIDELDGKKIKISPNPTTGLVNVSFGNSVKNAKLEICNLQGTQVFSNTFHNTTSATIDLTGNSAGIYMVKVIAGGVSNEEKIVKE
jgi:hypothetical protein